MPLLTASSSLLAIYYSSVGKENHANFRSPTGKSNAQCKYDGIAIVQFLSMLGYPPVKGALTQSPILKTAVYLPQYSGCCHQASRGGLLQARALTGEFPPNHPLASMKQQNA